MNAPLKTVATTEFSAVPADPMALLKLWFDGAVASNVREPGALGLATADAQGQVFNRIVMVLQVRKSGLVFSTHADSPKGRQLAETGRASGVLYWREVGRQIILSGPTRPLPDEESDALWAARPAGTHPMSVVSEQSKPLQCEETLRAKAVEVSRLGGVPPRPRLWLGYVLEPTSIEFWQTDPGRLHQRLRYEHTDTEWHAVRLQP